MGFLETVGLCAVLLLVAVFVLLLLDWIRYRNCEHRPGYIAGTRTCICLDCGKEL